MKTIWKFALLVPDDAVDDAISLPMPAGAQLLHAGLDPQEQPCVWALVDPAQPECQRVVEVHPTGGAAEPTGFYVGTFRLSTLPIVLHVFDCGEAA